MRRPSCGLWWQAHSQVDWPASRFDPSSHSGEATAGLGHAAPEPTVHSGLSGRHGSTDCPLVRGNLENARPCNSQRTPKRCQGSAQVLRAARTAPFNRASKAACATLISSGIPVQYCRSADAAHISTRHSSRPLRDRAIWADSRVRRAPACRPGRRLFRPGEGCIGGIARLVITSSDMGLKPIAIAVSRNGPVHRFGSTVRIGELVISR